MKPTPRRIRWLVVLATLTAGVTSATAQSIQFFTIKKVQGFTQTDGTTVTANAYIPASDVYPWRFSVDINGTSLDSTHPTPPNSATTPATSGVSSFNLAFDSGNGWEYRPGYSDQATMDAAFKSGSYTVNLANGTATPFALNLTGDVYPNNPIAALTGGSWSSGIYQLNPADAWSILTGTFSSNFVWDHSRIEIDISGTGVNFEKAIGASTSAPFGSSDTTGSLSLASTDAGAPTFVVGNTYDVRLRFLTATDFQDIGLAVGQTAGSAFGAALYSSQISFSIQAIPEPATYAAWAGLLALGLVAWRRRQTV